MLGISCLPRRQPRAHRAQVVSSNTCLVRGGRGCATQTNTGDSDTAIFASPQLEGDVAVETEHVFDDSMVPILPLQVTMRYTDER